MLYQKRQLEWFDKIFRLSLYLQLFHVKHFEKCDLKKKGSKWTRKGLSIQMWKNDKSFARLCWRCFFLCLRWGLENKKFIFLFLEWDKKAGICYSRAVIRSIIGLFCL